MNTGDILELPLPATAHVAESVSIPPLDSVKLQSLRVYDSGICTQVLSYDGFAGQVAQAIFDAFTATGQFTDLHVVDYRVQPIFETTSRRVDNDLLEFGMTLTFTHLSYSALGIQFGCGHSIVLIDIPFHLRRIPGTIAPFVCNDDGGAGPRCAVPGTFDFQPEIISPDTLTLHDAQDIALPPSCGTNPADVQSGLAGVLNGLFPSGVRQAFYNATEIDPRSAGLPELACTCDSDCGGAQLPAAPSGCGASGFVTGSTGSALQPAARRFRCDTRCHECRVQVEVDRVNIRPESMEFVLATDATDFQAPTLFGPTSLVTFAACVTPPAIARAPFVAPGPVAALIDFPSTFATSLPPPPPLPGRCPASSDTAAPATCAAPGGGFGTRVGAHFSPLSLNDCGGAPFDFYGSTYCSSPITVFNIAAGWASPSNTQSSALTATVTAPYASRGVRVVQVLTQDAGHRTADAAYCASWVASHGLAGNVELLDPTGLSAIYDPGGAIPATLIVRDGTIEYRDLSGTGDLTGVTACLDALLSGGSCH